ncbi:hypothetical protein [Kineosporia babensis]|uniref:Uncharacterized protein n=1 Tax=Kineosporia babensis TaxID=499548 RepID=A0A9X1NJR9_9ACTN|nr:hypothetical protein [Kineosporia babensis]MCD5314418.1 hypothetical protein [Kineosporia babensis]
MLGMPGDLVLFLSERDADPERLDTLTRQLRTRLLGTDVVDVRLASELAAPAGSRGVDLATAGALVITLAEALPSLGQAVQVIRMWLSQGQGEGREVRIELDGDVLELSHATEQQQDDLVQIFIQKHSPN